MCKVQSLYVPIPIEDGNVVPRGEPVQDPVPQQHEEEEEEEEEDDDDRLTTITILLFAGILALYVLAGMPCSCSLSRGGNNDSASLNDNKLLRGFTPPKSVLYQDSLDDDDDDSSHRQRPHRHGGEDALRPADIQFLLDSDTRHPLTDSSSSYSSEEPSSSNDDEMMVSGDEANDDDVMASDEEKTAYVHLWNQWVLKRRVKKSRVDDSDRVHADKPHIVDPHGTTTPHRASILDYESSSTTAREELLPNDDMVEISYDEVPVKIISEDQEIAEPVVSRRSVFEQ